MVLTLHTDLVLFDFLRFFFPLESKSPIFLLRYENVMLNFCKVLVHLGKLSLVHVDLLIEFEYLLSFGLLPIHLFQILGFDIVILVLEFSNFLTLLVFDKLNLLIVQGV